MSINPNYGDVKGKVGAPPTGDWKSGLCACGDDCGNCFYVMCCYPFAALFHSRDMGQISSVVVPMLTCCLCGFPDRGADRWRMACKYGINEGSCERCMILWFCGGFALCQEMREINHRGGYQPIKTDLTAPMTHLM